MDIYVNVVNQKLHITTNLKSIVAGTQNFVRFIFNLADEWNDLKPFAQFLQNGTAYNVLLSTDTDGVDNIAYLPPEITEGTCTLMLYGAAGTVIGTTNCISLTIDRNYLVSDASSIVLTDSLYQQMVSLVNGYEDSLDALGSRIDSLSDGSAFEDIIISKVESEIAELISSGAIDAMTIEDGSLTKAKMDNNVKASLDKADNSWQKSTSGTSTPTAGSWESIYDPLGYGKTANPVDPYSFAKSQDTNTLQRLRGTGVTINNDVQSFTVTDSGNTTHTFSTGLDATLTGVLQLAEGYADTAIANHPSYTVTIVEELPVSGEEFTIYLIPKDNGYEKYWYIQDENEDYVWDSFGSSSTEVVASLPQTGDADTDYIVGSSGNYQFYKYINNSWELIAGGSTELISIPSQYTIEATFDNQPSNPEDYYDENETHYYLETKNMVIIHPIYTQGESADVYGWIVDQILIGSPSTTKDYYVPNEDGEYGHYRYIDSTTKFVQIGSNTYSKAEIDELINDAISGVEDTIAGMGDTISDLQVALNNLPNLVEDVTISSDKSTLTIMYADDSTSNLTLSTGIDISAVRYNENEDYYIRFYDSEDNELSDLAVYVPGGGGGGGSSSGGTAYITRITPSTVQNIFGDDCQIVYTFTATDSSGDLTGSGTGTLYINNVAVTSGFTVTQGNNVIDVGEYLAVGLNTIKISVSVDTGGDQNTVTTKSWSVNAVNMYLNWTYTDSQINTSAVTDYYTPYGALSKNIYTFIDVEPIGFNPEIVSALPETEDAEEGVDYFVSSDDYAHYRFNGTSFETADGTLINVTSTARSGVQQSMTIPMQSHGSHAVVRYMTGSINDEVIKTDPQVHDMIFAVATNSTPIISTSFNTATMTQYNTVQIPIVVYNPASTTSTVTLRENGNLVSTWTDVDRTIHYWNYSPTTSGSKTLTITCGSTTKTIAIDVEALDIDEAEVTGYDFKFKASELATNSDAQSWSAQYTPTGSNSPQPITVTYSNNFDWVNGGLHSEYDENGHLRQYFCVRAGTTMTFDYPLFGNNYDPKQYGKNFKFIFKAVNCRTYDAQVLSCMDNSSNNNGVGLVMTANEATLTTVNESLGTYYYKDTYTEFETNIHPTSEYRYLQFWIDGSHDRNIIYSGDDGMQQTSPVGITIGSPNCDVYVYMVKAYPTYLTNENELSNFIMDAPNAYEMVDRYNRNDVLSVTGEIDYAKLAENNPDLRVILLDINRMSTGKKDNVVAYTARQIYNAGGATHCFTVNNACVTIQGTSSVGYLESAGNVDINFKNGRTFTSDNETYTTSQITFDDGSTSTSGYSMTDNSIPVDYMNVKVNVASSENANNACIADWYNTYQPWRSPARKKNAKARDTMEFHPGAIFIRDRSGNLFSDTTGYHLYGICDIGNSKKNTKVFHDTKNPIACCVEVSNNTSLPCLMSSKTYTWNSDDEATIIEDGEEQVVFEFRYVDEDNDKHVTLAKNAWDRFVAFMYDYNPNLATNEALAEPVTFGSYTFKGSGSYDTSEYDSDEYTVAYLQGYGAPASNGFAAADYVSDTTGEGICYYYIDCSIGQIYSSNGTAWAGGARLTWTPDNNNVLRGTSISTYAGTYTHDTAEYRIAYILDHCEEYFVMDPVIYHYIFIESFLMTDNVAKNTFWSSDDLVHWEPSKDYDNDEIYCCVVVKPSLIYGEHPEKDNAHQPHFAEVQRLNGWALFDSDVTVWTATII